MRPSSGLDGAGVRAIVAVLCVGVTVVALACGDDSDDSPAADGRASDGSPPGNLVSDREISRTAPDSPERTLLRFFQAVQFRDVEAARELIADGALRGPGQQRLRAAVLAVGSSLGKPRVVRTRREGDRATLRALVLGYVAGKDEPTSASPATFRLTREGGRWRLADLDYLVMTADDILEAERARDAERR